MFVSISVYAQSQVYCEPADSNATVEKEYIEKILSECLSYEKKAEEYDSLQVKHRINLVLGSYYRAYSVLDDQTFITATKGEYEAKKDSLRGRAQEIYISGLYGDLFLNEKECDGYWLVSNRGSKSVGIPAWLFAFEYLDSDSGLWTAPERFRLFGIDCETGVSTPGDGRNFDRAFVRSQTPAIYYRFIYEDEKGKIDVPEEWYFKKYRAVNVRNL